MRAIKMMVAVVALLVLGLAAAGGATSRPAKGAAAPAPIYPVMDIGTGCMLGGTSAGKWITADAMSSTVKSGQKYRVYNLKGYVGMAAGGAATSIGEPCEEERSIDMTPKYTADVAVASGGPWPAMPRVPKSLATNQPVYVKAVSDLLKARGIASPKVNIEKVLQIDLAGDRTNEVLISATYFAGSEDNEPLPSAQAGDYSILFMRTLVNGKVQTVVLADDIYKNSADFAAPLKFTLGGVLDLNGDGTMEIVVHSRYYEGLSSSVLQVKGIKVEEVLFCGCGA